MVSSVVLVRFVVLVGVTLSGFRNFAPFCFLTKTAKFPWSSKNLTDRNQLKKFMQVQIDVKCMHTNFRGCSYFGFGDIATFKNSQISLSDHGL